MERGIVSSCTSDRYRSLRYVELALVLYMTLKYGHLVEPLEVGKISNNTATSFIHQHHLFSISL